MRWREVCWTHGPMRLVALQVTVAALAAACGDPPAGANHDAAVSVPDVSPGVDAPVPDAPPACGSVAVGPGIRPAIASAAGHFAVAYLAVGPALGIAQYTVAGAPAGTATAPIPMFSTVPPAIIPRCLIRSITFPGVACQQSFVISAALYLSLRSGLMPGAIFEA